MSKGECASMDDVKAALEKQGMADFQFMEGDAVLFRYGWEKYWGEPATYNDGQPGICMDVARWVADDVKAGVTGGDTWAATDPVPYPDEPGCVFCVHQYLQTRHGIVNQENLALQAAGRRRRVRVHLHLQPGADHRRDRLDRGRRSRSTELAANRDSGAASGRARPDLFSGVSRPANRGAAGIEPEQHLRRNRSVGHQAAVQRLDLDLDGARPLKGQGEIEMLAVLESALHALQHEMDAARLKRQGLARRDLDRLHGRGLSTPSSTTGAWISISSAKSTEARDQPVRCVALVVDREIDIDRMRHRRDLVGPGVTDMEVARGDHLAGMMGRCRGRQSGRERQTE